MSKLFIELYLDEDVDVLVADLIRARGFTAITTRDVGNLHKVGATSGTCRSYGAWELLRNAFYKHSAPLALWEQRVCQQYPKQPQSKGSADLSAGFSKLFI